MKFRSPSFYYSKTIRIQLRVRWNFTLYLLEIEIKTKQQ